jgi:hypothetical protein
VRKEQECSFFHSQLCISPPQLSTSPPHLHPPSSPLLPLDVPACGVLRCEWTRKAAQYCTSRHATPFNNLFPLFATLLSFPHLIPSPSCSYFVSPFTFLHNTISLLTRFRQINIKRIQFNNMGDTEIYDPTVWDAEEPQGWDPPSTDSKVSRAIKWREQRKWRNRK